MGRVKYKTTGCAKFFLVVLILAPIAYIGASYLNGEDGLGKIKNLFASKTETEVIDATGSDAEQQAEIRDLTRELRIHKKEIARLEDELQACQEARNSQ